VIPSFAPLKGFIPRRVESISFLTAINGGHWIVDAMTANSELQPESKSRLRRQPDGSYALGTSNGFTVVSADNGGGLAHSSSQRDNLFTTQTHIQDWEKFRIVETSPGLYTIQTVSGFFVAVKTTSRTSRRAPAFRMRLHRLAIRHTSNSFRGSESGRRVALDPHRADTAPPQTGGGSDSFSPIESRCETSSLSSAITSPRGGRRSHWA
jgi:hypothetical protein